MILASTLRYLIERATQQADQWDRVECREGPEAEDIRERGETLIGVMRDVAELPLPPKESHVSEHAHRVAGMAFAYGIAALADPTIAAGVERDIEDYLRKHFMETTPPDGDEEEPDWVPVLPSKPPEDDDDLRFPGGQAGGR